MLFIPGHGGRGGPDALLGYLRPESLLHLAYFWRKVYARMGWPSDLARAHARRRVCCQTACSSDLKFLQKHELGVSMLVSENGMMKASARNEYLASRIKLGVHCGS